MPTWKPSRLRSALFKGDDWLFSSDGETFTLSTRGHIPLKGPLLLIQAFAYRRKNVFPATGECRFVVSGERTDQPFGGLKPDQADELKRFLDQHVPESIAAHALRGQKALNEWQRGLNRRLDVDGFVEPATVEKVRESIPSPIIAGVPTWGALFNHPQFGAARERFSSSFPLLGITPVSYLDETVERHNRQVFDKALQRWSNALRKQVEVRGWIGRRMAQAMLGESKVPEWPARTWRDVAPAEFQPSAEEWLEARVSAHNAAFESHQMEAKRSFFERVESNPLTEEQARAVVCMDDELLVVAAAGSGKSSTIVAKAGYALEEGLCAPEEILLLAFNADAAEELRHRIGKRLGHLEGGDRITAKTFHAFGLEVIGAATGKMPTPAPWLSNGQDEIFIGHLVDELCAEDPAFLAQWDLFRLLYFKDVGRWDAREEPEDYDPESQRKRGFRTLRGEIVKSKSERLIADWLFLHGANYHYEEPYPHDTRTATKRQYRPDFYYPDIDVFHEHFALDAEGEAPPAFKDYLEGVHWKRQTHRDQGTRLFETTAHGLRTGAALAALKELFQSKGIDLVFDPDRVPPDNDPVSPQAIAKVMRVFQQHMKGSRQTVEQARERIDTLPGAFVPRMELFLDLYEAVAQRWEDRLAADGLVDFDDMLNQSADHIAAGRFSCSFKMVLADEFQDTSRARMRLLQAIIDNSGAQFTAVGDDWQSIYRFAGADLAIMAGFQKAHPHASIRHLSQTFRCPQSLCDLTSAFVSKNPMQLAKTVITHNPLKGPRVSVVALPSVEDIPGRLKANIQSLHEKLPESADGKPLRSMLILGRYRKDRPKELDAWRQRFGDKIDLRFLTVHRAKGLEADFVALLNVVQDTLGFPSQVQDDPILQLAMPEPETFEFGEERRLFYVALTRAKRSVVVYTIQHQPSQFLVELQAEHGVEIVKTEGEPAEACPVCGQGVLVERVNRATKEVFHSCSRFPRCPPTKEH
ncbi:UvrD-helicase domain-containing protein [Stenotrophomonas sepilia]|uniref:UvrD-helicase domain-containing protein n=1 Tax=Stenotrophomonas sepilia TaxID=2860290 RepID=UPI002E7A79FB|nr:UvrD-helicase domain-containing protein [Stenotrophomonas sepilia]